MAEKTTGHIYTVSKLTREIKTLLEETYPFIWVTGEISNFAIPGSGHCYFTLKDQTAVISCVMFKNQNLKLKFSMESGMHIVGLARLALYEPRGSYQLIFEHIEPEGAGSMQVAFEQLKKNYLKKAILTKPIKNRCHFYRQRSVLSPRRRVRQFRTLLRFPKDGFQRYRLKLFQLKFRAINPLKNSVMPSHL